MTGDTNPSSVGRPGATSGQPEALEEFWGNLAPGKDCVRCGRKPRTWTEFCDQCEVEYTAGIDTGNAMRAMLARLDEPTYPNGDAHG